MNDNLMDRNVAISKRLSSPTITTPNSDEQDYENRDRAFLFNASEESIAPDRLNSVVFIVPKWVNRHSAQSACLIFL